jgi:hypothetical protein
VLFIFSVSCSVVHGVEGFLCMMKLAQLDWQTISGRGLRKFCTLPESCYKISTPRSDIAQYRACALEDFLVMPVVQAT